MAHATIVLNLGPKKMSWKRFLLAASAHFDESISCIPGIALVAPSFSTERNVAHPV